MYHFDRIYELHKILSSRRTPIPRKLLEEKMECSRATIRRTIEVCRDYLGAPIKYDRKLNGYYYDKSENSNYELPGLWFNSSEIHALLTTHSLLSKVQPGLLEPHISPLMERLNSIIDQQKTGREIEKRIRILQATPRIADFDTFRKAADALVCRKKIKMLYHGRERDKITERWISPQRMVYYRDNWYLDGWCHLSKGLRTFSLDRMHIVYTGEKAKDINEAQLNEHFADAYGIFAGKATNKAVIRFSKNAAKWVADEHWHSKQESNVLPNGELELTVPYSDPRELIMDILKYGAEAEVIFPAELREEIKKRLWAAQQKYQPKKNPP
jgi:predicted DNA-binding transcriptional regulator YafY